MQYWKTLPAIFLSRPNRFLAVCQLGEETVTVHVKNTGRCAELLVPGCTVWLEPARTEGRKTPYDLIGVEKGEKLINMDAQAPNAVTEEALRDGSLCLPGIGRAEMVKREVVFGDSRFDFYLEAGKKRAFLEVKGVTLEQEGICKFPDAPTERGIKHIEELIRAKSAGYEAALLFVIQMEEARFLLPNDATHPAFGEALRQAETAGVSILARNCRVTSDTLTLWEERPVYPSGIMA